MKAFDFSSLTTPVQEDSHLITYCFEMIASAWDGFSVIIVIIFFASLLPCLLSITEMREIVWIAILAVVIIKELFCSYFKFKEKKNHCSFSLFSALNVIHYGRFLCSCSSWGRSWFRWLIAEGSRSSCSDVHWGQEFHSQFKPEVIFLSSSPSSGEGTWAYREGVLLDMAGVLSLTLPRPPAMWFVVSSVPQAAFLP